MYWQGGARRPASAARRELREIARDVQLPPPDKLPSVPAHPPHYNHLLTIIEYSPYKTVLAAIYLGKRDIIVIA